VEVAVVSAVVAVQAAQVGSGLVGGDGALFVARDGGRVVVEGGQGAFAQVEGGVCDVRLSQDARLLEVAVGDVPVGVVERHDAVLDVRGKGGAPKDRRLSLGEEHPAHADLGGIHRPDDRGVVRDELGEACGARGEAVGQEFELVQMVAEVGSDTHAVLVGLFETELHGAKESRRSRDGEAHEAQFAHDALPFLDADPTFAAQFLEDGGDPCFAAVRELQGAGAGV
jgi:hypothetical protein